LIDVLPLKRGIAFDQDAGKARAFASEASGIMPFTAASALRDATRGADVIVTCTIARTPFLGLADIAPGPLSPQSARTILRRVRSHRR
jgi:ornithine cyclodeaminase/alanine dehydrogenase-like protein (mu-crystallin family)